MIALPAVAACQDPKSWQAFPVGAHSCGAVMRSPRLVQAYCYLDGNRVMGFNVMTQPILPDAGAAVVFAPKNAQYEVGDPYNVPIGGIRWEFESTPAGIHWTMRQATPGGAGVVTTIPKSYSGVFTKVYGT